MKRYSVSYGRFVNEAAAKDGIKFHYSGRTDNPQEVIERYNRDRRCIGLQIKDSVTKKVVFSDMRKVRGALIITFDGAYGINTYKERFVDLTEMREREHYYRYNYKGYHSKVINVEREIY